MNGRQMLIWNRATLLKQFWVLALKKDRLWVQWVHSYYTQKSYLMSMKCPKSTPWMLAKI